VRVSISLLYIYRTRAVAGIGSACGPGAASPTPDLYPPPSPPYPRNWTQLVAGKFFYWLPTSPLCSRKRNSQAVAPFAMWPKEGSWPTALPPSPARERPRPTQAHGAHIGPHKTKRAPPSAGPGVRAVAPRRKQERPWPVGLTGYRFVWVGAPNPRRYSAVWLGPGAAQHTRRSTSGAAGVRVWCDMGYSGGLEYRSSRWSINNDACGWYGIQMIAQLQRSSRCRGSRSRSSYSQARL
jgi:hypothetical protein